MKRSTVIILLVLLGGMLWQRYYHPAAAPARAASPAPRKAPEPKSERLQNIEIGANLRQLRAAQEQYLRAHPGKIARYADLVGPGKTIAQLIPADGESYPEEFLPGTDPVATLPNGVLLSYDTRGELRSADNLPGAEPVPVRWSENQVIHSEPTQELQALLAAARSHDRQSEIQAQVALMNALRRQTPRRAFLQQLRALLEDRTVSPAERALLLDTIDRVDVPSSVRFLTQLATTSPDRDLRLEIIGRLSQPKEWSPSAVFLEQIWCESNDPELLAHVAPAMAQLGAPTSIELLLAALVAGEEPRTALARRALQEITKPTAVPLLAAQLARLPASSDARQLVSLLARLGNEEASQAVLRWLANQPNDASDFIRELGTYRPKQPELLAAAAAALDPAVAFLHEPNRGAIGAFLAPPAIAHPLRNGSFEDGTLSGFTLEGQGGTYTGWSGIEPTERRYMAFLHTMEDPRDGVTSLTSDPFEVPAGMKTLLFDYDFCASVLLHPVADVLEASLLIEGAAIRAEGLFAGVTCPSYLSGFEESTGFRTAGIPVEAWAGTGKPLRFRITLKGRGALPDRIPGTNRFDHNPMALGKNPGTGLFLDNLRLSTSRATGVPPLALDAVTVSADAQTTTIRIRPGAFPPGATIFIRKSAGNKLTVIEPQGQDGATYQSPFHSEHIHAESFTLAYATAGNTGDGCWFSPLITVRSLRARDARQGK